MSKRDQKSIVDVCPQILDWWDFEKNGDIDPHSMSPGNARKKLYFKCPECGSEIYRTLYLLTHKNDDGSYSINPCQKCHPTKSKLRVSLDVAVPDIEEYWDYEKNEDKAPSDFGASASNKVWTKCPICGTSVRRNIRFTWEKDENGIGHVICCRKCGKIKRGNSLTESFPQIVDYWDYDKNDRSPEFYTIQSGERVYTRCPICNKERYICICDLLVKIDGKFTLTACKECRGEVIKQRSKSIVDNCPELFDYWNESNTVDPDTVTVASGEIKITLKCPECGKPLTRFAVGSFIKDEGTGLYHVKPCMKCANSKAGNLHALANSGSLIEECPEIIDWWDFENNDIDIKTITRGTHNEVNLICPRCNHSFKREVKNFVFLRNDGLLHTNQCPECGYSYKGDPDDNLLKVCPSIDKWWNYEKNYPFRPENFTKGSQFAAYLTCPDCGMELHTGIHSMVGTDENGIAYIRHKGRCRKYRALSSENNLVLNYPEVKDWWDYDANNSEIPEEYTLYSTEKMTFKCPNCGVRKTMRISDAFRLDDNGNPVVFNCTVCNNKKALAGYNSLADTKPGLVSEWSPNNVLKPSEVLDSSYTRVLWICPECHGEYSALIKDRNEYDDYCPYCSGKKILKGFNTLTDVNPELASEWSENNDMRPDDFLPTSTYAAKWICPTCHGEYSYPIRDRYIGDDFCPYCNNKKVLKGYNTLKARHSELVENEWCYLENILLGVDPDNILENYRGKVWWKCPTCGQKYIMTVHDRLLKEKRGHVACLQCNGKRWKRSFNVKI